MYLYIHRFHTSHLKFRLLENKITGLLSFCVTVKRATIQLRMTFRVFIFFAWRDTVIAPLVAAAG